MGPGPLPVVEIPHGTTVVAAARPGPAGELSALARGIRWCPWLFPVCKPSWLRPILIANVVAEVLIISPEASSG
ncbi:MAG: hypothetical protein IPH03_17755 [Tetrasphaera sp.]|nr:hypothetical protein [Tetrasphaera sp.]